MKIEEAVKWDVSVCGLNCAKCDIYEACHGNKKLMGEILACMHALRWNS